METTDADNYLSFLSRLRALITALAARAPDKESPGQFKTWSKLTWEVIPSLLGVDRRTIERMALEMYRNEKPKRDSYPTRREFLDGIAPTVASIWAALHGAYAPKTDDWDLLRRTVRALGWNPNRKAVKILKSFAALRRGPSARLPHPRIRLDSTDMALCDKLLVPQDARLVAERLAKERLDIRENFPLRCLGRVTGYPERFGADKMFLENLKGPLNETLELLEERKTLQNLSGEILEQVILLAAITGRRQTLELVEDTRRRTGFETFEHALRDCQRYFGGASVGTVFSNRLARLQLTGSDGHEHAPWYRGEFSQLLRFLRDWHWNEIKPYYGDEANDLIKKQLGAVS